MHVSTMATAEDVKEHPESTTTGVQQRSTAEGAVMLPALVYNYLPGMWPPHAMFHNWGTYGPVLAAHDGSFYSGKRKPQNISDACASCRRSKVKCDEEKPCRRCVKHGRAASCASWRLVPLCTVNPSALRFCLAVMSKMRLICLPRVSRLSFWEFVRMDCCELLLACAYGAHLFSSLYFRLEASVK